MQIPQRQYKGSHLNTLECVYIYTEYLKNNHLNDDHTIFPNMILEALLKPHQPQNSLKPTLWNNHTKNPSPQQKTYLQHK